MGCPPGRGGAWVRLSAPKVVTGCWVTWIAVSDVARPNKTKQNKKDSYVTSVTQHASSHEPAPARPNTHYHVAGTI